MAGKVNIPDMEIAPIGVLKPYWNNPRVNDAAVVGLKASITEFGFNVPIVVDVDMVLVTGHTRYKAALELGLEEVPIIIASHLSAEQIKAFRIADNRLSEDAKWDETKLQVELRQLNDMGFSMEFTGFSAEELDCLCGQIDANCLQELDYASVCGAVGVKATQARDNVVVSVGNYRFYVHIEDYKLWEGDMLQKHPKRSDLVQAVMVMLGFSAEDAKEGEAAQPGAPAVVEESVSE
jgi:ParB family chromosome partitioning protein